jgi:type I restriction enzyme S subunit
MELMPGYKMTEVGIIPEDWKDAPLGELAEIRMCKRIFSEQTHPSGDIPFFKIGTFGKVPDAFISSDLYREYKRRYSFPKKGDVLLSAAGTLGRTVVYDGGDAYFQDSNIVWLDIDHSKITNEYLYQCYQAIRWASPEGSTISRLYNGIIRKTKTPLPPTKTEQRAIAQALSDVDALLATLDQMIAKKRDLKQAAMQQLLTGKTRLLGFSGDWEMKRLGEIADVLKGNTLSKSVTSASGMYPCILYGELFTIYDRVISNVISRTNSNEGCRSVRGDVLLPGSTTTTGADLATASALLVEDVALGGDILIVRSKEQSYDPVFLASYLTHTVRRDIAELTQGITIHHLYGKDLKTLSLQLPSLSEQTAIATVLSSMDSELSALEARRDKIRNLKQAMMQELLTGRTRLA